MTERLIGALRGLQEALRAQPFAVPVPEQAERRERRDRLAAELDGHIARVRDLEAPLLAVLGGGTGAGKSTVANSLVGHAVTATGVIRPTTSSPTVLLDPLDREWFTDDRVLPGHARVHGTAAGEAGHATGRVLHIVESHAIRPGLAVLDTPDIDSVRTENRALADELLDAADVWAWFVTGRTYADEEGMRYLRRAARRRTALAVVLTQVHERESAVIRADLVAKLADEGLVDAQVLVVPHASVQHQRLPERAITELRTWLRSLAEPEARAELRRQTLEGALDDLRIGAVPLLDALTDERKLVERLEATADLAYERMPARFAEALEEGPPLRQEVIARWSAFVGTSRFLSLVESATGMVRSWVRDALSTVTTAEHERIQRQVRGEVADTLADLVVAVADLTAVDVTAEWETTAAGRALVEREPALRTSAPGLAADAERALEDWQDSVTELIRTKGAERKVRARWLSTVVNAAATAAILLTFASTGGLTGVEAGVAAGASAANQALLVKLLGAQNLNWVLRQAREDLLRRVAELTGAEQRRFTATLDAVRPSLPAASRLDAALEAVEDARGEGS